MKDDGIGVQEMRCPVCNKVFAMTCPERWVYKRTVRTQTTKATIYYCSYSCTTKADREREEVAGRRAGTRAQQRAKRLERGMYIAAMRSAGFTWQQVGEKLGISKQHTERIYTEYLNHKSKEDVKSDQGFGTHE